ncbi:nicotinate-nucleotide--dimethylbenzimidazole phosphoribosyltransferase [Gordonia polyisoprenivorans NBRC 16320 = JCM 10675]|uniref:Nicotinate-nucleotide--dimethylbenzimidazole phosphoribosyltransferase n=1 Tax=Gordonia polyisoprenivorans TaxID=84595 RepID=A0A846WP72_9ACTN|nr:nicotinate-nucleotide--dimethylbenzimidazole phosphoribosyltransferase [Gordonia polyisoprenivorans]NKY03385.1 nicotinate-nucleotide--dimethylbenzimidazole phosphoribosyltransferase [Gordonia polyisoprenivorans]GAB23903.1 nicotinate-nucleotide--dimethylbenzimidazole phosphoribosyltransferase [Gordonia polyisoprenivorans NBRC 16320 = JCM 10675]
MTARGVRTLVLGGVRSGKSAHGEQLLRAAASVRYVATGPTLTTDAEWTARVERHRQRRDPRYTTVETSDLASELRADPHASTLVDDLGNWLAARLDATGAWSATATVDRSAENDELCSAIAEFTGDLVLISPEVGLAPVAPTPAGRLFQDELGALNEAVAAVCDRVILVVAGRIIDLTEAPRAEAPASPDAETTPAPTPPAAPASAPAAAIPMTGPVPDATDAEIFDAIDLPDEQVAEAARARQLELTKPPGSLGRLEEIGVWISACQGVCPPRPIETPTVVVFAGDHGVAQGGVSAFPSEVTAQMVANIAAGGAAVNVLARRCGATVRVADIAVDADTGPEVSAYKVRRSSNDLRVTDALTIDEARRALAAGRAIVDDLVDSGADLLIAGDMGIGNTTPAAIIIGTLARREPVEVVGRGTGIDDVGWMRKTAAIRDGMRRGRRHRSDPLSLIAAVGGADLAAMAGFLAQAAVRRTPVILDGVVVTAAALIAVEMAPGATRWWLAGHRSVEPAHAIALEYLDLEPLHTYSMRLGEGTGALSALPTVLSAVDIMTSMSTFADAGVSDADALPSDSVDSADSDVAQAPSPT